MFSDKTEVTIAPGVTTGELMDFFLSERVCFYSDVILMNVTYGGVMSTGCHVCLLINALCTSIAPYIATLSKLETKLLTSD